MDGTPAPAQPRVLSAASSRLLTTVKGRVTLLVKQPPEFLSGTHSSAVSHPTIYGQPNTPPPPAPGVPCPVISWRRAQGSGGARRGTDAYRDPAAALGHLNLGPWDRSSRCQATTCGSGGASLAQRGNEELKRHGEVGAASDPRPSCTWRKSYPCFFGFMGQQIPLAPKGVWVGFLPLQA